MTHYIGIDPGSDGIISVIDSNANVVEIFPYPKVGKEFDHHEALNLFDRMKYYPNATAIIEDVHKLPKPMNAGDWALATSKAIAIDNCVFQNIPFTLVPPKTWQKEMWQGVKVQYKPTKRKKKNGEYVSQVDTKATSELAAKRLFPNADLRDPNRNSERATKVHDGVCDSLLMALYGLRKNL